jgi:hypothetical protein
MMISRSLCRNPDGWSKVVQGGSPWFFEAVSILQTPQDGGPSAQFDGMTKSTSSYRLNVISINLCQGFVPLNFMGIENECQFYSKSSVSSMTVRIKFIVSKSMKISSITRRWRLSRGSFKEIKRIRLLISIQCFFEDRAKFVDQVNKSCSATFGMVFTHITTR